MGEYLVSFSTYIVGWPSLESTQLIPENFSVHAHIWEGERKSCYNKRVCLLIDLILNK